MLKSQIKVLSIGIYYELSLRFNNINSLIIKGREGARISQKLIISLGKDHHRILN